jgi:hypothetical protein
MSTTNTTRWIGIGLLGLPLYGALTFLSSIDPQPDPNTHLEAWARYVTTDHYVLGHLLYSILGLIFAIERPAPTLLRPGGGGSGPAQGAMTPPGGLRRTVSW